MKKLFYFAFMLTMTGINCKPTPKQLETKKEVQPELQPNRKIIKYGFVKLLVEDIFKPGDTSVSVSEVMEIENPTEEKMDTVMDVYAERMKLYASPSEYKIYDRKYVLFDDRSDAIDSQFKSGRKF